MKRLFSKQAIRMLAASAVLICFMFTEQPFANASQAGPGILLADKEGHILYEKNAEQVFIPASILKVFTSLAALHYLGENFRFSTLYHFDPFGRDLYIKGKGDPLFISEQIKIFSRKLASDLGGKHIRNIFIDQSYFSLTKKIPGRGDSLNPYDAPVCALSANFNTLFFKWSRTKKQFASAEPQTPLLPVFYQKISHLPKEQGRIPLTDEESRKYAGRLIRYFLKAEGIETAGNIELQTAPVTDNEMQEFKSDFDLNRILAKLLRYSNNFIANQLTYTMGARVYGIPATLGKGTDALDRFARETLGLKKIKIAEGSGLSRLNRVSPKEMIKILICFMPHADLLNQKGDDYYKTGTLSGVRTRAGYLAVRGELHPYVIMINGQEKSCLVYLEQLRKKINRSPL